MINLTVKTLDSSNHKFTVEEDATVQQLKEKIGEKLHLRINQQRLIFCGRVLQNEQKLNECGVNDGKCLHLVKHAPPCLMSRNETEDMEISDNDTMDQPSTATGAHPLEHHIRHLFTAPTDLVVEQQQAMSMTPTAGRMEFIRRMITEIRDTLTTLRAHTGEEVEARDQAAAPQAEPMETDDEPDEPNETEPRDEDDDEGDDAAQSSHRILHRARATRSSRYFRPRDLGQLLHELELLQEEFTPFRVQYIEMLSNLATVGISEYDREHHQRTVDLVCDIMHSFSHGYHAVSDIAYHVGQYYPRLSSESPSTARHPLPMQAHINVVTTTGRRATSNGARGGQQAAATASTNASGNVPRTPPVRTATVSAADSTTTAATTTPSDAVGTTTTTDETAAVPAVAVAASTAAEAAATPAAALAAPSAANTTGNATAAASVTTTPSTRAPSQSRDQEAVHIGPGLGIDLESLRRAAVLAASAERSQPSRHTSHTVTHSPGVTTTTRTTSNPESYQVEIETRRSFAIPIDDSLLSGLAAVATNLHQGRSQQDIMSIDLSQLAASAQARTTATSTETTTSAQTAASAAPSTSGAHTARVGEQTVRQMREIPAFETNLFRNSTVVRPDASGSGNQTRGSRGGQDQPMAPPSGDRAPAGQGHASSRGFVRGRGQPWSRGQGHTSSRGHGYSSSRGYGYTSTRGRGLPHSSAAHQPPNVTPNRGHGHARAQDGAGNGNEPPRTRVLMDLDNLLRGLTHSGGVEVVMSMEELPGFVPGGFVPGNPIDGDNEAGVFVTPLLSNVAPPTEILQNVIANVLRQNIGDALLLHQNRTEAQSQTQNQEQQEPTQTQGSPQNQGPAQNQNRDNNSERRQQRRQARVGNPRRRTNDRAHSFAMACMVYDRYMHCDSQHARRHLQERREHYQQQAEAQERARVVRPPDIRYPAPDIDALMSRNARFTGRHMAIMLCLLSGPMSQEGSLNAFMVTIARRLFLEPLNENRNDPIQTPSEFSCIRLQLRNFVQRMLQRAVQTDSRTNTFEAVTERVIQQNMEFLQNMSNVTRITTDIDPIESIRVMTRSRLPAIIACVMSEAQSDMFASRFYSVITRFFTDMCTLFLSFCEEGFTGLLRLFDFLMAGITENYEPTAREWLRIVSRENLIAIRDNLQPNIDATRQYFRRADGSMPAPVALQEDVPIAREGSGIPHICERHQQLTMPLQAPPLPPPPTLTPLPPTLTPLPPTPPSLTPPPPVYSSNETSDRSTASGNVKQESSHNDKDSDDDEDTDSSEDSQPGSGHESTCPLHGRPPVDEDSSSTASSVDFRIPFNRSEAHSPRRYRRWGRYSPQPRQAREDTDTDSEINVTDSPVFDPVTPIEEVTQPSIPAPQIEPSVIENDNQHDENTSILSSENNESDDENTEIIVTEEDNRLESVVSHQGREAANRRDYNTFIANSLRDADRDLHNNPLFERWESNSRVEQRNSALRKASDCQVSSVIRDALKEADVLLAEVEQSLSEERRNRSGDSHESSGAPIPYHAAGNLVESESPATCRLHGNDPQQVYHIDLNESEYVIPPSNLSITDIITNLNMIQNLYSFDTDEDSVSPNNSNAPGDLEPVPAVGSHRPLSVPDGLFRSPDSDVCLGESAYSMEWASHPQQGNVTPSRESLKANPEVIISESESEMDCENPHDESLYSVGADGTQNANEGPQLNEDIENNFQNDDEDDISEQFGLTPTLRPADTPAAHFSRRWEPVLEIDENAQMMRAHRSQPPFSDAYLSGMPSPKRRCVRQSRPDATLDGLISEGLRGDDAGPSSGLDPNSLHTLLSDSVRTLVQQRANAEPEEFNPAQFSTTATFLDDSRAELESEQRDRASEE